MQLPFLIGLLSSKNSVSPSLAPCYLTMEEPLPAVIAVTSDGYVTSQSTRMTEVARETTDDN